MKKKLLLVIFAFFLLFVTGCEKKEERSVSGALKDLKFVSPSSYIDKQLLTISDEELVLIYKFDESDPLKNVTISYYKNQDYSFVEENDSTYETVTINGVSWRVVHTDLKNTSEDFYYVVYKDALYQVDISNVKKYEKEFDAFVNSLSFS